MSEMLAIHVVPSICRLGLLESTRHLSQSIPSDSGIRVSVVGLRDSQTDKDTRYWDPIPVRTHPVRGLERFGYAPGMTRDLLVSDADVVHLNGLWKYPAIAVLRWARRTGRPYTVSPHGMLEPWSLQQSRTIKRVASWLYQGPCLHGAACIRATSLMEAESIRQAGYETPIALIPNGVVIPEGQRSEIRGQRSGVRKALFLSRIHPKKGLLNLIEAWHIAKPVDWQLVIVGPDEGGHLAQLRRAVRGHELEGVITFVGQTFGEEKARLYSDADLFILPTFSENFGVVIAEALSCGVPVITTRATPWQELEEWRCGWWIDIGVKPLVEALKQAVALPPDGLAEMGLRGRKLVEERYSWEPIGKQMADVYEWMLGRCSKPDCIIAD